MSHLQRDRKATYHFDAGAPLLHKTAVILYNCWSSLPYETLYHKVVFVLLGHYAIQSDLKSSSGYGNLGDFFRDQEWLT
jgi:hypothetical protein